MIIKKYTSFVTELTSFITKHSELKTIQLDAEFDLRWRLIQLFKDVKEEDEQKFIDMSGMQGHLMTSSQKLDIERREKESDRKDVPNSGLSELTQVNKKTTDKVWAKSLYKRAVRRCHPDTLKVSEDDYREEITQIYKNITESYENDNLDILMVEAYKLFIKPKDVINEQIQILEVSKNDYIMKINDILKSQGYFWSTLDDEKKEILLINLMKQKGVRFIDKEKVKEILKRKISNRKMGQRPKNKLRNLVKNKK